MSSPRKLGDIMESVLSASGCLSGMFEWNVKEKWVEIVGKRLSDVSEFKCVENGILYIRVPQAAWRQEMSFFKETILAQIADKTRCKSIKDIVFC
jgi:hypothetical protein